jgi:DeoR family transcriptional regulator of aga operon
LIQERGFVRVSELSRIFRTSPVTIRTDLDNLEALDLVRRIHGGAVPTSGARAQLPVASEDPLAKAKAAIGVVAASLVEPGQTIALGGGTTARAVARALAQREDLQSLTAVTNGLDVALELRAAIPRFTVIVTGGSLRAEEPSLVDPLADLILRDITADLAISGCNGISAAQGVTGDQVAATAINRRLLSTGVRRVVVADATKVGAVSVARFWDAAEVDVLVTESSADSSVVADLRGLGVEVETVL